MYSLLFYGGVASIALLMYCELVHDSDKSVGDEPRREKTGFLHMRKQRRRSASR